MQKFKHAPQGGSAPSSLRERAYLDIKRRINRLEFRPGAYLNEAQICRQLRIGRTPVHQALDRLMMKGLVQVVPRKGVLVQPISLDEVFQILEMRLINEPYCAELASERASSDDISGMKELLYAAGPLIRARDREKLMALDRAFHYRLSLAPCNSILADMMTMLHERSLRFWFISFSDDLHLRRTEDEHRDILDAIAQRDRQGAAAAMRAHIESSRKHVTRNI